MTTRRGFVRVEIEKETAFCVWAFLQHVRTLPPFSERLSQLMRLPPEVASQCVEAFADLESSVDITTEECDRASAEVLRMMRSSRKPEYVELSREVAATLSKLVFHTAGVSGRFYLYTTPWVRLVAFRCGSVLKGRGRKHRTHLELKKLLDRYAAVAYLPDPRHLLRLRKAAAEHNERVRRRDAGELFLVAGPDDELIDMARP